MMATMTNTVGMRAAERALQLGAQYTPEEALAIGLVDEVVPETEVLDAAHREILKYLKVPEFARQLTKETMRKPTLQRLIGKEAETVESFINILLGDDCQQKMGVYIKALKDRKK